jgi:serine protease
MQGTSMAAPHVAGVAALMMTANPNLTPAQVEQTLKQTARPLPGSCDTGGCGAGLVDAGAAVKAAMPGGQPMPEPAIAGAPSVQGEAKVGSALTADPGTWTPGPVTFTYEWLRNDSPIANAAGNSYIPDPADAGASLKVRVTASGASFNGVVATSAATAPVAEGTQAGPSPVINGTAAVGRTLTANPGSWAPGTTLSFQWYRSGVASLAATGSTYTVGAADLGHALTVSATGTRDGYAPLTVGSTPTPAVVPGTLTAPIPLIGGTRKVGYTLTAAPGAWSAGTALKYQWYRSGVAISGATASRYTLGAYDQGKTMRVRVTGTRVGYTTLSKDSASTTAVATGSLTAGTPWISGYPRAGYTLTANPGAWTAGSTLRYQWYRSGVAIAGATAKTYRLVAADRYDTIKFRVVGSKAGYNTVTKYSGPSIRIP